MKSIIRTVCLLVVVSLAAPVAHATDTNTINLSGKQRMLTQKMSKEALMVALGIDAANSIASLQKTRNLFDKTLTGLKDGDPDLGLKPTKKPKIVKQLKKIRGLWETFDGVVSNIVARGSASGDQISLIASQNLPLLKEMNRTVKFYEATAASGNTNPALAKAINLAGRQRMLTQKMSKEFFLTAYGNPGGASLGDTIALFDGTLKGLIYGDPSQGLPAAPNADIKAQLEKVDGLWKNFKAQLEAGPGEATNQAVAQQNVPLLKEMNKAVQLYVNL